MQRRGMNADHDDHTAKDPFSNELGAARLSVPTIADRFSQTLEEASVKHTRIFDFLRLIKPRVMLLAVFPAVVRFIIAPGTWIHSTLGSERWSNGQTEGQFNRLKTLKRGMYGRSR